MINNFVNLIWSQIVKRSWHLVALILVAGLLTGCVFVDFTQRPFYQPYYAAKDLTFDSGLSGRWSNPDGVWEFTARADKSYFVTTQTSNHETNYFNGHLFLLQGQPFLDLCSTNRQEEWLHEAVKVARDNDVLRLAVYSYPWAKGGVEAPSAGLRHLLAKPKKQGHRVYIEVREPNDPQKSLLKHLDHPYAYTEVVEFHRQAQ